MHKRLLIHTILGLVVVALAACAPSAPSAADLKPVNVKLARAEAVGVFALPWTGWPVQPPAPTPAFNIVPRYPITLSFVFELENPNDVAITLDQMKFNVELEAKPDAPGEYFSLATPTVYDRQTIPGKATNSLRVNALIDSGVVPGTLTVAYGQQMAAKKLNANMLVNYWWDKVGDLGSANPAYGVKLTGGLAEFSGAGTRKQTTFEAAWPK